MLLPGFLDALDPLLSDPLDLAEPGGFLGNHPQRIRSELVHDLIGIGLADPMNQSAGEILAYAVGGGGKFAFEGIEGKLPAVLGVIDPLPGQGEGFSALHLGGFPDHRDLRILVAPLEFADEEAVLLVVKSDAFENPFEAIGGGTRGASGQDYLVRL